MAALADMGWMCERVHGQMCAWEKACKSKVCMCMCVGGCVHVCMVHACVDMFMGGCVHGWMHAWVDVCMDGHVYGWMCTRMCTWVDLCMHGCEHRWMWARVDVCRCGCVHMQAFACIHVHMDGPVHGLTCTSTTAHMEVQVAAQLSEWLAKRTETRTNTPTLIHQSYAPHWPSPSGQGPMQERRRCRWIFSYLLWYSWYSSVYMAPAPVPNSCECGPTSTTRPSCSNITWSHLGRYCRDREKTASLCDGRFLTSPGYTWEGTAGTGRKQHHCVMGDS